MNTKTEQIINYLQENVKGLSIEIEVPTEETGMAYGIQRFEPELKDLAQLLLSADMDWKYMLGYEGIYELQASGNYLITTFYDYGLSFRQNLESNPELCDYLINLFNLN